MCSFCTFSLVSLHPTESQTRNKQNDQVNVQTEIEIYFLKGNISSRATDLGQRGVLTGARTGAIVFPRSLMAEA